MAIIKRSFSIRFISILLTVFIAVTIHPVNVNAAANITTVRMGGSDRFQTAVLISQQGWTKSDNIVLANAYSFPDALTGVPFAYMKDAPILLTEKASIPNSTKNEIIRLGAKNIYILGGTGVINQTIENNLKNEGYNVQRLGGADRFQTAEVIGKSIISLKETHTAILTTAYNFPDALAIGSYAAMNGYPVLFSETNTLNTSTEDFINTYKITNIIIVGGPGAISGVIQDSIWNKGIVVERIDGMDRYTTALNISKEFRSVFTSGVFITTGEDFPDALAGGVLAAKKRLPILLTEKDSVIPEAGSYIRRMGNVNLFILGGSGVVSDKAVNSIKTPLTRGSVYGNVGNFGYAAEKDGWIYYSYIDTTSDGDTGGIYTNGNPNGLFKMKADGTSKTKLLSVKVSNLNVKDGWIYYVNENDYGKLYRIKTDGTGNQKVYEEYIPSEYFESVNLYGNSLYYYFLKWNFIVKLQPDGHKFTRSIWEMYNWGNGLAMELLAADDYIYYSDCSNGNRLCRVTTELEDNEPLNNCDTRFINKVQDYIIYCNRDEGDKIYKLNLLTRENILLSADSAASLNVSENTIYYSNASDGYKLYKMDYNGNNKVKLTDTAMGSINLTSTYIIYVSGGITKMMKR